MKSKFKVTNYNYSSTKLPKNFDNYQIVHLSDLHERIFARNNEILFAQIQKCNPDIIVITGDLIDSWKYKDDYIINIASRLVSIAPTYYVSGNHEARTQKYEMIKKLLINNKVKVLDDQVATIILGRDTLFISGLMDPSFNQFNFDLPTIDKRLDKLINPQQFNILLSHRPEYFTNYVNHQIDLVLCGHTHAGQIRLPLIGALYVPGQGLFPKYDYGEFKNKKTTLIINAGLGYTHIPIRLFNKPEIVVITLQCL